MKSKLEVGDEVTCPNPNCNRVMLRCIKVPEMGMLRYDTCFENVGWSGMYGSPARCQFDDEEWAKADKMRNIRAVHVKDKGWIL